MDEVIMIPLEKLLRDEEMVLRNYNQKSLEPLKKSMKDGYNAKHPITVFPEGNCYKILDGVKRYLVCKELGYDPVPCEIITEREGRKSLRWMKQS